MTTAVRRPASAATSQTVFARRSSRLVIDGRVRRSRSVAVRTMRPTAPLSAPMVPCTPATRRVSMPATPCTSADTPVAIVVHARAGSDVSCGSSAATAAPAPPSSPVLPVDAAAASASNPSMATSLTRCPADTTVRGGWTDGGSAADGAVKISSAAPPKNASAPPTRTTRHDRVRHWRQRRRRGRSQHRERRDPDGVSEQQADDRRRCERDHGPQGRVPGERRAGRAPPQRQVGKTGDRRRPCRQPGRALRAQSGALAARANECRRDQADTRREDRRRQEEQRAEVERKDQRIAGAADESRNAQAESCRRQDRAAAQTAGRCERRRGPRGLRASSWPAPTRARSDRRRRRDSRAIAAAAAARRRARRTRRRPVRLARAHRRLAATNADSSRSRSARAPNGAERAIGRLAQLRGQLARAVHAAERHERRLARVLAHRLAGLGRIAFDVEQVVDDLKREPEILRVRGERGDRLRSGAGRHRAARRRGARTARRSCRDGCARAISKLIC